ncbi:MAG TPA: N-methyl-L-tryptophan oxidase [Thermomicrobiales bacterium]|nr:N-methyl-L-tryptophan oxidase [Thermomicrobiales bacterium]
MNASYDTIVVGLGAMGSATVYQLAKRGQRVLGLEMFQPGHDQGSSHGNHRMIRMSAVFADGYTPLAERALDLWHTLEEESGGTLLRLLGEIHLVDPASDPTYAANAQEMRRRGLWEILSHEDLAERFPGVRLRDDMLATYEAKAGFLRSEAGILAHLAVAERHGATVVSGAEVTGWSVDGDGVRVTTGSETYTAERLIITTGPWAAELLADLNLPLRVERVVNGYFEPGRPDWWSAEQGAPDFLLTVPEGSFYGMPAVEGIGLKIGLSGGFGLGVTTARTIDRHVDESEIDFLRTVLDTYMPGASGQALRHVTCMCTYTPDKGFVVDRHPAHEQVLIGCGFSGRGYKFAPTVGEILADLATAGATRHDINFMSATRFGR